MSSTQSRGRSKSRHKNRFQQPISNKQMIEEKISTKSCDGKKHKKRKNKKEKLALNRYENSLNNGKLENSGPYPIKNAVSFIESEWSRYENEKEDWATNKLELESRIQHLTEINLNKSNEIKEMLQLLSNSYDNFMSQIRYFSQLHGIQDALS